MTNKLLLFGALAAVLHFSGATEMIGIGSSESEVPEVFTGTYTQEGPSRFSNASGPVQFGLRFIDDKEVDMLVNGYKEGPTMSYTVDGDAMVINHACGTWQIDISEQGNRLYNRSQDTHYVHD